ncbi:MAG: BREX-1 system phosphatase PglZ type B, partial [Deltaproteobacteria bacterium]|nr:BREX-1 system phosphatase PglZ type B [Deltaproteobacteria bacterium]
MTTSGAKRRGAKIRPRGLLEALELSFAEALRTPEGTAEPVALLWTDADSQWKPILPRLRPLGPQISVLGEDRPAERSGPAIWLRCVVDRALPDVGPEEGVIPVVYLPGVRRQDLRAGAECPPGLQPLVELQYRGRVWHQRNGRDWTVEAFLVSEDGLGLEVAQDARTREALLRALPLLAEAPAEGLRGRRLDADDFDRLAITDPMRDLLRWMSAGDLFRTTEGEDRWRAFGSVCRSEFSFDPEKKSPSDAAKALAEGRGKWQAVWDRFREAPRLYPGVSQLLRDLPGQLSLEFDAERSPRMNDEAENRLRRTLEGVAELAHGDAVARVLALEAEHGRRRGWIWAELGESPLAVTLEPLARLAALSRTPLGGATLEAAVAAFAEGGWQCDRAALEAMAAHTPSATDTALIRGVVRALYGPWLDATARHFQSLISADEAGARELVRSVPAEKDVCVLFADGLRFDVADLLRERLETEGVRVRTESRLVGLPTVTATTKPLAAGAAEGLTGGSSHEEFSPEFLSTGQIASTERLRADLGRRGVDLLGDEVRIAKEGLKSGWMETGRLDELGHKVGAELSIHLESELAGLAERVLGLLQRGWTRVRVVTDHGWLLLPGGLPKVDLPAYLAATRWARCAAVKGASEPSMPIYGWHWNPDARIASPPGAACFAAGKEYAHGGVSPQECVVPELVVERGSAAAHAAISDVH